MAQSKVKIIKKDGMKKMDKKTVATKSAKAAQPKKASKEKAKAQVEEEILMQPPRGMRDLLPGDQPYWNQLRRVLSKLAIDYGF
ncbi:MAG: hypothetical protein PHW24_05010, partial [Candidatus Moranbacteria bacterium]|nr:hypothetical protein [Candidatus Moranbacteria bacterium]